MLKNKIVAVGLAGVLAMPLGLAACGNSASNNAPAKTETTETTESTASTTNDSNSVLYWEGKLSDGQSAFFMQDKTGQKGFLGIFKTDASDGTVWTGKLATSDDKVTITDDATKQTINITITSSSKDNSTLKVKIDGYGEVDMKATTQAQFQTQVANELVKATVYWEGTLADGSIVDYMDGMGIIDSALSISKADGADAKTWIGKASTNGDKLTITDETTKETVTFTVENLTKDETSAKINVEGYGEASLKAVSAEQAAKQLGDELAKTTVYWEGTLPNGSLVNFINDAETGEQTITIINADGSDAKSWSGKVTTTGETGTITDNSTKQTITYTAVNVASDLSSYKMNIDGYGEVELKPVTAGAIGSALNEAISTAK